VLFDLTGKQYLLLYPFNVPRTSVSSIQIGACNEWVVKWCTISSFQSRTDCAMTTCKMSLEGSWGQGSPMQFLVSNLVPRSPTVSAQLRVLNYHIHMGVYSRNTVYKAYNAWQTYHDKSRNDISHWNPLEYWITEIFTALNVAKKFCVYLWIH
jgi:hypothetical protein